MRPKLLLLLLLSAFVFAPFFLGFAPVVRSAFDNVVINEIQIAGPGGVQDEFVELYNPTAGAIDITGWRLTRATSTGGDGGNLVASLAGVVPPGGFFLIANDDYSGAVSPDQQYSADNNIAADNTVSLYSDNGLTLVDRVGLGGAALFEGAPVGENPASGGSAQRIGQDTENNVADFEILEVSTPQNSNASPSPTPTPTAMPTSEPTASPTPTPTPVPTEEPTNTPIPTSTPTESPSPVPTPSEEPSPSPTVSSSPAVTPGPERGFGIECSLRVKVFTGRFVTFRMPVLHCQIVR